MKKLNDICINSVGGETITRNTNIVPFYASIFMGKLEQRNLSFLYQPLFGSDSSAILTYSGIILNGKLSVYILHANPQ